MEKESVEEIQEFEPIIYEKKIISIGNLLFSFFIGIIIIILFI